MGADDKHAATYHGGAYVPDTDDIREQYVAGAMVTGFAYSRTEARTEFERWLATVKAQALIELADQMRDKFTAAWIRGKAREYTHGPHKPVGAFSTPENKEKTP